MTQEQKQQERNLPVRQRVQKQKQQEKQKHHISEQCLRFERHVGYTSGVCEHINIL